VSRCTDRDIFESYVNNPRVGQRLVQWQPRMPFAGRCGHYYFIRPCRRAPTNDDLARITRNSHNAEATLTRINDTYIVHIGNRGVATASLMIPSRQDGIEEFQWIAHTHPLEQEDAYQRIARGPTAADRETLRILSSRWGQTESLVIVCRRGRVETCVPFRVEPSETAGTGGRLWTPSRD
jgi:hypothetical protein